MALEMNLKLNAPGMTSLHKTGLAGLYMTLKAFDKKREEIEGLEWELEDKQITLCWTEDKPKGAFERLIKESFWIDDEGFIRLYGLEPKKEMSPEQKHLLYQALLNSFLQFGPHRPTGKKQPLSYKVDDDKTIWLKEFKPIKEIKPHKKAISDFIDKNGDFKKNLDIVGWLYPGGGQRHQAHKSTTLNESPDITLALLFAPVGVIYYLIRSTAKGRKSRLALLIPEIKDLKVYSEVRQVIAERGVIDLTASSSSDAALRMLVALKTDSDSNQFAKIMHNDFLCRVITFGIVDWNEKQKSRTAARTIISGNLKDFENYYLADSIFENRWQQIEEKLDKKGNVKEPAGSFVTTFCGREMIADNIASNKNWYHDISEFLANRETRKQLYYEQKELGQMVKKATYENENERIFIDVCHESWRRRMGKLWKRAERELGKRAERERIKLFFSKLVDKEREKLRTAFVRCRNAETLRETVVDFWSRAGSIKQLQGNGLANILPLFDEEHWRKTKDLALLALISYQSPEEKEDEKNNENKINGGT